MMATALRNVGLDGVASDLAGHLPGLWASEAAPLLGRAPCAGSARPLPSSVVQLRVGDASVWVMAPELPGEPERGLAPVYRHAGRRFVFPFVRLFTVDQGGEGEVSPPRFLSLGRWLEAAF